MYIRLWQHCENLECSQVCEKRILHKVISKGYSESFCFVLLVWSTAEWRNKEIDWLMFAYIALFSALLSRLNALACGSTWVTSFIARLKKKIHQSGVLTALAWLVPHETTAVLAQVLCIPYNHAPCHFMQSHICKVYVCLAVTCYREWPGSFTCYCGNTGVERIPK